MPNRLQTLTLYSGPLSMYGAKAHIAALEKGLAVNLVMVPFTDDHRYEPKHPEVLRINPKRQVPVLTHGAVEIFDSTQIFEYFEHIEPHPPLWPAEMEALLTERDYLCGEYTYADIAFFMAQLFAARKGAPMTGATPRLLDWRRRVAARPAVQPTLVLMTQTLTRQGRPVPQFMRGALAVAKIGRASCRERV